MIGRALFELAARGYQFPAVGALRVNREYKPQTFPAVRVRVLRPFYALRRLLEVGEVVELLAPDAESAVALGRAVKV